MTGRRVYPDAKGHLALAEGDYGKDSRGVWMCRPPGEHVGDLSNHDVTEHEDGTITVSPSILITWEGRRDGVGVRDQWHGYLERGVWRTC